MDFALTRSMKSVSPFSAVHVSEKAKFGLSFSETR